ncbi:MAG TPA: hypothetical protein VF188_10245 [Longimicrobiales bacterium]
MKQTVAKFLGTVVAVAGVLFALSALARVPEADALGDTGGWGEASCFVGCCSSCANGGICCSSPFPPFPGDPYPSDPIRRLP